MTDRKGDWLQTYTGKMFWPLDPRAEDIAIRDIAGSLSKVCRYGGHCLTFYSVAEHSVWVSRLVAEPELKLTALLHDAAEAYVGDKVRPLKRSIPQLSEAEEVIAQKIAIKFDLYYPLPDAIKVADEQMLATEAVQIMAPHPSPWHLRTSPIKDLELACLEPEAARRAFLNEFRRLGGKE